MELDGNDILRAASSANYPREAIPAAVGDNVQVWAKTNAGPEGLVNARVIEEDPYSGRMRVMTMDGPVLEYGEYSKKGRFTCTQPAFSKRTRLALYVVLSGEDGREDARGGANGLLLGPGARSLGKLLAVRLKCIPDSDASDNEKYWLYIPGATAPGDVSTKVSRESKRLLWSFICLQSHLEQFQKLDLTTDEEGYSHTLKGPNSLSLKIPLQKELGSSGHVKSRAGTRVAYSKREEIKMLGVSLSSEKALTAVRRSLRYANLPERLVFPKKNSEGDLGSFLIRRGTQMGWRCTIEGPSCRYPQILAESKEEYSCPGNTLAVHGPRNEASSLLHYAKMHAEAPMVKHVEMMLSNRNSPNAPEAMNPTQRAGYTWSLQDLAVVPDSPYFGPWSLRASDPTTTKEEDVQYQYEILNQWSDRNIKRTLEGECVALCPARHALRINFTDAPYLVEYRNFVTHGGVPATPRQGWCGLVNPVEWIEAEECDLSVLVWPEQGAIFRRATARPSPKAKMSKRELLSAGPQRRLNLLRRFVSSQEHIGLPDLNGVPVTRATPLWLCPAGHPEAANVARIAQRAVLENSPPSVFDIEDAFSQWEERINSGERPCPVPGCHRVQC